jgi:hypothetical protein
MEQLTKQQVFDKVKKHLLTQNKRALDRGGSCLYRAAEGLTCAAGCLISDDVYSHSLEGKSASSVAVARALEASGVSREYNDLVCSLQCMHDIDAPENWPVTMKEIASHHGLVNTEV